MGEPERALRPRRRRGGRRDAGLEQSTDTISAADVQAAAKTAATMALAGATQSHPQEPEYDCEPPAQVAGFKLLFLHDHLHF